MISGAKVSIMYAHIQTQISRIVTKISPNG